MSEIDKKPFYDCFCDSFASNGEGMAYVYHDGNYVDIYNEGVLEAREVITHEQYMSEYRAFISKQTLDIKEVFHERR